MANVFIDPIGSVATLHLSFHLDSHYNSIRRGDDPMYTGIKPLKQYKIGHDLDKVKKLLSKSGCIDEDQEEESKGMDLPADLISYALRQIKEKGSDEQAKVLMRVALEAVFDNSKTKVDK